MLQQVAPQKRCGTVKARGEFIDTEVTFPGFILIMRHPRSGEKASLFKDSREVLEYYQQELERRGWYVASPIRRTTVCKGDLGGVYEITT